MLDPADHAPGASPHTLDQVSVTSHKTTETSTSAQKGAMTHEVVMSGLSPEGLSAVAPPSEDNRRKQLNKTPHPPARKQTKLHHFFRPKYNRQDSSHNFSSCTLSAYDI